MEKLIAIVLGIFLLSATLITLDVSGSQESAGVRIIFDNKNATLSISVNNTQHFYLKFSRIFISTNPSFSPHFMDSEKIDNMNIEKISSHNSVMGNYTKITMWKEFEMKSRFHHGNPIRVKLSLNFYIAEKTYRKNGVNITGNMIRYSTIITTTTRNAYVFLEEHMNYGEKHKNGSSSRVFECNKTAKHWKLMSPTKHVMKHRFGSDHLGMVGFGRKNVTFRYMWEYQDNINTLYSYDGSNFVLYFIFQDKNGSIVQDPYITLPEPISLNTTSIVNGIEHTVNYIMDHALSLGIGIILAAVIVFSAPMIKRRL